jgi:hypothetical protein
MTPIAFKDKNHPLSIMGVAADEPGLAMSGLRKRTLTPKGIIGLLICFLAGVAATLILLYTLF